MLNVFCFFSNTQKILQHFIVVEAKVLLIHLKDHLSLLESGVQYCLVVIKD